MFDKNVFKETFRSWVNNNPQATEDEALAFCQHHIPANVYASHFWLVEQSLQWFSWLKAQQSKDNRDFSEDDLNPERVLC